MFSKSICKMPGYSARGSIMLNFPVCNDFFVYFPQNSERMNTCVSLLYEGFRHSFFWMIANLSFFTQSYYLQKFHFPAQTEAYSPLSHDYLTLFIVVFFFLILSSMQLPSCEYKILHTGLAVSPNIINFILYTQTSVHCILYFSRHPTSFDPHGAPGLLRKKQTDIIATVHA